MSSYVQSKVSKKIWAVHQCVDRLPESLQAAKELLQFGLQLTNEKILDGKQQGPTNALMCLHAHTREHTHTLTYMHYADG